jgi:DNA-binding transcriptional LysR family regulator
MTAKRRAEPDWQDVRTFLALGRHGSLSAAARALAVNHATIARRLQALEATLGRKLVDRRPDGYVLTPEGREVLAAAGDMETAANAIGRGPSEDAVRGLVRINSPPAIAQGFLVPRLARLVTQHPGLDIDLATDLRPVSLERHEADIAVRSGHLRDGDFIAKPLVTMGYGFYGTRAACQRLEAGGDPVFVGFDEINAHLPEATWIARRFPKARVSFRANNHVAQAMAAQAGAGLVLLPHYIGRSYRDLRLCRIDPVPPPREAWLLMRRENRKQALHRTVADFIEHIFSEERAMFEA